MQNQLNPRKITIIQKAKSWAITDARIAGRCSTHGICNTKAIASVQNVVPKWEQPKKKKNTRMQKNTGTQGNKKKKKAKGYLGFKNSLTSTMIFLHKILVQATNLTTTDDDHDGNARLTVQHHVRLVIGRTMNSQLMV
jgi:hypothetical protein